MKERINDKIKQISKFLEELYQIAPTILEDYLEDFTKRAACERYFEKIIEGIIDLAFLVIKYKKLKTPEDEESSFIILKENHIINELLCDDLRRAKGMRNILAHQYGEIDDEKIFNAINENLEKDIKEFINSIELILK